jgi:hypothetical protein
MSNEIPPPANTPTISTPPAERKMTTVNVCAHTLIDFTAMILITGMVYAGKLPIEWMWAVLVVAGVWAKMQSGSAKLSPSGGLILGLASGGYDLFKSITGRG